MRSEDYSNLFTEFVLHLYEAGTFFIPYRQAGFRLFEGGSRHNRNIFCIFKPGMEELLNLINFFLYVMVKDELVCLTFLTSSQPELSEKIFS